MARMVQLLVRDPSGAVWNVDVATGETVRTEANHAYQFAVGGKPASFPAGTSIQRSGRDLKIRFADGEELLLTDWYATPGASLTTRGARLLDADGASLPAVAQMESGVVGADEAAAAASNAAGDGGAAAPATAQSTTFGAPPATAPTTTPATTSTAAQPTTPAAESSTTPATAQSTAPAGAPPTPSTATIPSPPATPAAEPPPVASPTSSGGGLSGTGILAGLGGVALLGAAAGGGGGGSSGGGSTTPPTLTAPSELALAAASDSGTRGDGITNDDTPTISGRADANASITVRNAAGTTLATATADASGNWSATPGTALLGGVHALQVIANRGGGASDSAATSFTVTVDTTAPAAPVARLDAASDSGVSGDNRTNDATPTLSGTGVAGDTIRASLPGGVVLTTTVASDGSWSVTPTTALASGANALSVTAMDAAGNVSAATSLTVTVDTTAPAAPAVRLDPASDSGTVGDDRTNDTTPTLSGSSVAGDTIRVTLPGGVVLTTTVAANGSWSVTPTTPLATGANAITVNAIDAAGNVSAATPLNLNIVTTGPAAPTAQLAAASDSGIAGDGVTGDTTPTISGTGTAGHAIRVTLPGGTVLSTTVAANGGWSVTPVTPLANGPNAISVTATDAVGNVSAATPLTITVDSVAPTAPVLRLDAASDSGTSGDNRTNDTTPTLSGTGIAGDTIRVTLPGGVVLSTTVAADGSWSVTPTTALANGAHAITATATDVAGNASVASTLSVTVDTTAPAAPSAQLAAASDSGTSGDNRTNDTTPTISGTGTSGDTIRVSLPGGVVLTTTVAVNGSWSVTPTTALANGAHAISVMAVDAAGNVSTATALTLTIDTVAPAAPAIAVPEGPVVSQAENADGIAIAVSGSFVAGDTVAVLVTRPDSSTTTISRALTAGEVTAGSATVTVPAQSIQGAYALRAQLTDAAGNTGTLSPTVNFTLDTQVPAAPTLSIAEAADTFINEAEAVSGGGVPATVSLPPGTAAGDVVSLVVDGPGAADTTLTHTVAAANVTAGSVSILIPTAALATNGGYSVAARITDGGGNTSANSAAVAFTVDRTAPAAPSTPDLTTASDTGISGIDNLTRDTTPTFSGSGATSGSTVQLVGMDGVTIVGTGVANGAGNWTITTGALAAGTHAIAARQVDAAGNVSAASTPLSIIVDTAGPTFGAPPGVNEGFASVVLSPASLGAADDISAQAALGVTAASFVPGNGFVAGDFTVAVAGGQATVTRNAAAVDKHGSATFALTLQDAAGNTTVQNVSLAVASVNDAPAGTNGTLVAGFNTPLVIGTASFGFTDANDSPADALASVIVVSLPVQGQLTLGGLPVAAGQEIAAAQIAAGNLVFTPGLNESGVGYASFTFRVRDDGGTANGGVDLDPTPNTLTISVMPFALLLSDGGDEASLPTMLAAPQDTYLSLDVDTAGNLAMDFSGTADAGVAATFASIGTAPGPGSDLDLLAPLPGSSLSGLG